MVRTKQGVKVSEPAAGHGEEMKEGEVGSTTPEDGEPTSTVNGTESGGEPAAENGDADSTADNSTPSAAADSAPAAEEKKKKEKKKASPKKGKKAAAAAAAAAAGDAAAPADGAATAAENGEVKAEDAKKKKKPAKKTIPAWTTLSSSAKERFTKSSSVKVSRPRMEEEIVNAINVCADSRGSASAASIRSYMASEYPDCPKHLIKKALKKAIDKKLVKQVKGTGFSGSFKVETAAGKKAAAAKKGAKPAEKGKGSLDSLFPMAFTWACNPKEASVTLIRKYIAEHYPSLDVEGAVFKKAIEAGEKKGQLKRITGKGTSGTFALVDGADKSGAKYEDAIESAIIAMNEPKDCSVNLLRDYLGVYHKEYNTDNRPYLLKKALERAEGSGHILRVTGKGFSGTFRLAWPFHPSPQLLWGDEYKDRTADKTEKKRPARAAAAEDSEDESDEEAEEVMPTPKKRGAPSARASAAPPAKKSKPAAAAKPVAKKSMPVAKKSKPVVAKKSKPATKSAKAPKKAAAKKRSRK